MIEEFKGYYSFLSNMYVLPSGKSVEHYFQASKSATVEDWNYVIGATTPYDARFRGRSITARKDWLKVRDEFMLDEVRSKFYIFSELKQKLLDTKDELLVEGNTWGDKYWGVDLKTGIGENKLGKILMSIREELKCK